MNTNNDDSDTTADDPLLGVLNNILAGGGGSNKPATDPMMMMMLMQDRAERAAAARGQQTMQLIGAVVTAIGPALIAAMTQKKETDPALLEIIKNMGNANSLKESFGAIVAMTQQTAATQIQATVKAGEEIAKAKDEMYREIIDRQREERDKEPAATGTGNALVDGLGHLVNLADRVPGLLGKLGGGSAPIPALPNAGSQSGAHNNPQGQDTESKRDHVIAAIMGGLRKLHQEPRLPKGQRAQLRGQLVAALAGIDDLAEAVLNDDMDGVVNICGSSAMKRPELLTWATAEGTTDWLKQYLGDVIAPALAEVMDAEDGEDEDGEDEPEVLVPALPAPTISPMGPAVPVAKVPVAKVPAPEPDGVPTRSAQPVPVAGALVAPAPPAVPATPPAPGKVRKPPSAA